MNPSNRFSTPHRTTKGIYLTVLIFYSSFIYGQSALNILDLYHESFAETTARIITKNARIGTYDYHMNVAGIFFQAVASPAENLKDKNISLDFAYNRLLVRIGTKTFYPDLPVWQLLPIVRYVDSPYSVVFSQLGDTTHNQEARCRFHPAFLDNLLGLRLFQADLLNLTDILWDIPIDAGRRPILAPTEQPFTPYRDSILHRMIYEKLANGNGFTSFVLTDKNVNFVFDTDDSGLLFSGQPYYYFTKTILSYPEKIQKLQRELHDCYNDIDNYAKIILKDDYTPALNSRTGLADLLQVLSKHKEEKVFNPYAWHNTLKAVFRIDSLNRLTNEDIGIEFQVLDDYSESFKPFWTILKKFNPLVFSAVENTAQWSAFFRYVREADPNNWTQFVQKVESNAASDAPAVQTPTSTDYNYFRYVFEVKEKRKR